MYDQDLNAPFSKNQQIFIETFVLEFVKELEFLADKEQGRAQGRASFFEYLTGKINLGASILNQIASFFPLASTATAVVGQLATWVVNGLQYVYEADRDINIHKLHGLTSRESQVALLKLMLEQVAREAARRYEFFLNYFCETESVALFAQVGIARILRYFLDNQGVEFSPDHMLRGLIEGKSGSGADPQFHNNFLKIREDRISDLREETVSSTKSSSRKLLAAKGIMDGAAESSQSIQEDAERFIRKGEISAETVYGRSAVMDLSGNYYMFPAEQEVNGPTFGFTKMYKQLKYRSVPLAGVMVIDNPDEISEFFRNTEIPVEQKLEPDSSLDHYLKGYRPGYAVIKSEDIQTYLDYYEELNKPSFLDFL